jgi:hypothetical protein
MSDFRVWVRISTDSRKAAPCGDMPRPMVVSLRRWDAGEKSFALFFPFAFFFQT